MEKLRYEYELVVVTLDLELRALFLLMLISGDSSLDGKYGTRACNYGQIPNTNTGVSVSGLRPNKYISHFKCIRGLQSRTRFKYICIWPLAKYGKYVLLLFPI